MSTVVVRIAAPAKKGGPFPVELLASSPGDSVLKPVAGARATIPAALTPESAVGDLGGQPLTAARVREIYPMTLEPSEEFAKVGEFLYRLLHRGKLGREWARLRDAGAETTLLEIGSGAACRVLHELPWERMYDPDSGSHLFLESAHILVRADARTVEEPNPMVHAAARKHAFPVDDWPLRVLVIFGARPELAGSAGLPGGIGATSELEALETLFATCRFDVECEVLEHPTRAEIKDKCDQIQPHILHFIGHAEGQGDPGNHRLKIWRPGQGGVPGEYLDWALHDIRNDLQDVPPLRLAFLNACRTSVGQAGGAAAAPFGSIADTFLKLGALGVLGMQGDVPADVAVAYSKAFYASIIAGEAVHVAAAKARRGASQLASRPNVLHRCAWSFPVLRTRVLPWLVLPALPRAPARPSLVKRFVTQVSQRRRVREALRTLAPAKPGPSPHLVAIVGEEDSGKTHLAKWCIQTWARGGSRAAYVSFGENESLDIVDALRCMRDGALPVAGQAPQRDHDAPLGPGPARSFTWELNHRLRGMTLIPPLDDGLAVVDDGQRLAGGSKPDEGFFAGILGQFRLALEESAKPNGLLLALDQLSRIQEAHLSPLIEHVLTPIAAGNVKGVRAIVVARTLEFQERLKALPEATIVELGSFDPAEFERVVRHLSLQWAPDRYEDVSPNVPRLRKRFVANRWKAGVLWHVDKLCEVFEAGRT